MSLPKGIHLTTPNPGIIADALSQTGVSEHISSAKGQNDNLTCKKCKDFQRRVFASDYAFNLLVPDLKHQAIRLPLALDDGVWPRK